MSPVFRHGGLRLYLLKLLDEAPRHGYDVIRLLQDKFLGVYSPSPGTIYPRLARLEEEGLVTHETADGKKVYRITEAGREELNRRLDDLADLEDELAASVRDIATEITRDVRETVRNLRDELTWAVREAGRGGRGAGAGPGTEGTSRPAGAQPDPADEVPADEAPAGTDARAGATPRGGRESGAWRDATTEREATTEADEAAGSDRAARADAADDAGTGRAAWAGGSRACQDAGEQAGRRQARSGRGDWREWADWADPHDWRDWADWARRQSWGDWTKQEWKDRAKASKADWAQWTQAGRTDWLRGEGSHDRREPRPDLFSDLEHLAAAFAREIRGVARQAENLGDDAVGNLGRILFDTLNRIRTEVFRAPEPDSAKEPGQAPEQTPPSTPESGPRE